MPRIPNVRRHARKGRRPWFTLHIGGKEHHLGTDRRKALAEAGRLKAQHYGGRVYTDKPETVAELTAIYRAARNPPEWEIDTYAAWAGVMTLDQVSPDHLTKYLSYVHTLTRRGKQKKNQPLSRRTIAGAAAAIVAASTVPASNTMDSRPSLPHPSLTCVPCRNQWRSFIDQTFHGLKSPPAAAGGGDSFRSGTQMPAVAAPAGGITSA